MRGWIMLHRQITENELYFSEPFTRCQAWIDLLLCASHKRHTVFIRRGIGIDLKPGDLCYSQQTLAERWQWNFKTVRVFLEWLKEHEMVEFRTTNVTTVISIKNWEWYQTIHKQNGKQSGKQSGEQNGDENGDDN